MKYKSDSSENNSMSAEPQFSLKLRILALVVITADLINERTTPSLGISHAIISPVAIFTSYFFLGILVVGSFQEKYASYFLQIYALLACSILHMNLSIVVFKELRRTSMEDRQYTPAQVLNGILPMFLIVIALADLIGIFFANRDVPSPVLPVS